MEDSQLQAKAFDSAVRMLGQREHSQVELRRKLQRKYSELSTDQLDHIIDHLLENDWLSDQRFAKVLFSSRCRRGYGPFYIGTEMRTKGVPETLANSVMGDADVDWVELASDQVARRYADAANDLKVWEKAVRFLQRRGFPHDLVSRAVGARPPELPPELPEDELAQSY